MILAMDKMNTRLGVRKLELVCVLCNESLADLEKACAGAPFNRKGPGKNNSINENNIQSETNTALGEGGGAFRLPTPHFGGYHPINGESQKDVVATKCGHMFHQGCLRKHVHKTLVEGKGGSLFCPICTRPFTMNRLWQVVIPPTRAQRERYIQLKMMKEQNADMVKQLKEIRAKIAEEESRLNKIKEESEECLQDIQQKQKLLDSVNGPSNKEMVELTKMHMKRQEILHVVTQHNADLLKLLAEESNISTSTAEKMINVKNNNYPNYQSNASSQHFLGFKSLLPQSHRGSMNKVQFENTSELYLPLQQGGGSKKSSKKERKKSSDKGKRKSKKKSRRHLDKDLAEDGQREDNEFVQVPLMMDDENHGFADSTIKQRPSREIQNEEIILNANTKEYPCLPRGGSGGRSRPVDTVMKWNMESVRELMSLDKISEASMMDVGQANYGNREDYQYNSGLYNEKEPMVINPHDGTEALPILKFPQKDSNNIMLARKAPIILNKNIYSSRKLKK